jgi:hypothetical protein
MLSRPAAALALARVAAKDLLEVLEAVGDDDLGSRVGQDPAQGRHPPTTRRAGVELFHGPGQVHALVQDHLGDRNQGLGLIRVDLLVPWAPAEQGPTSGMLALGLAPGLARCGSFKELGTLKLGEHGQELELHLAHAADGRGDVDVLGQQRNRTPRSTRSSMIPTTSVMLRPSRSSFHTVSWSPGRSWARTWSRTGRLLATPDTFSSKMLDGWIPARSRSRSWIVVSWISDDTGVAGVHGPPGVR